MEYISVTGGRPLQGELWVSGAKNSVLPILAASVLCREACVIHGCPRLTDVDAALEILTQLGGKTRYVGDTVYVDASSIRDNHISKTAMGTMRSSILFLGPLLARTGSCSLYRPGGCQLGERPIDLHLKGLHTLGAEIKWEEDHLTCCGKLKGGTVVLPYPSVGATENLILAALGGDSPTTICNAAREPEIGDLIGFLRTCGAEIDGKDTGTLRIKPGNLHGGTYTVMADRAEAATWLSAVAATGGSVSLRGIRPEWLSPVLSVYRIAGCRIRETQNGVALDAPERLKGAGVIRTAPYPGFPTDAQAPVMASFLQSRGITVFEETVFSQRYRHVPALKSMGADITTASSVAVVTGVAKTYGADMESTDLRGGAAMVVAALAGHGQSRIFGLRHIRRGYGDMTGKLRQLGAEIWEQQDEPAVFSQGGKHHEQGSTGATLRKTPAEGTG